MREAVIPALRLAMEKRHELHEQQLQLWEKLIEYEKLQEQTIVNLSNQQYAEIAKAVDAQRREVNECSAELHYVQEHIFTLVAELLQSTY